MATLNWDDLENQYQEGSKPAPAGRYVLVCKSCKEGTSKAGNYQITFIWEIAEGPFKGKGMFDYLTINKEKEATIRMTREGLNLLGFKDLKEWGSFDEKVRTEMCLGKKIEADVSVEEYQGRVSNKVRNKIRALSTAGGPVGVSAPPPLAPPSVTPPPPNPLSSI